MFTGLIGELGEVIHLKKTGISYDLTIRAHSTLQDIKIGDSVSVNGACLTVTQLGEKQFTVQVMPETTRNTIIHLYKGGTKVNLERTLRLNDRLDGHLVSGHVDVVGTIAYKVQDEIAWKIGINIPAEYLRHVVKKGSITVDGISLTVTQVTNTGFEISIIPHTFKMTTLGYKSVNEAVNIETDILAKYIERLLTHKSNAGVTHALSLATLARNGFI